MNEFKENRAESPPVQDYSRPSEHQDFGIDAVMTDLRKYSAGADAGVDLSALDSVEAANVREYGLRECCDAAKGIFTREVLSEWGTMSVKQREQIIREYSTAVGDGLNINLKGVVFKRMEDSCYGCNNGNGYVYINENLLKYPYQGALVSIIDTVAHEARHQMQSEAIQKPEKFGVDQATINEWKTGDVIYNSSAVMVLDPWGYNYNPLELDARYFGESVVQALKKDLINNA